MNNYLKIVRWSDDDQCFIGSCPALCGECCHGDDEVKVYAELCSIVENWISIYKTEGKPLPKPDANKKYSGKLNLRLPPELHERLSIEALIKNSSLNDYMVNMLTK